MTDKAGKKTNDEAMDILFSINEFENQQKDITEIRPLSLNNVSKIDELIVRTDSIEGRLNFLISLNEELDEKLEKILGILQLSTQVQGVPSESRAYSEQSESDRR